jgi:catechol 2,3-dioxygenase-like lactoylglutathione lyase family enzyme
MAVILGQALHHVTITVRDLDASLAFYRDALGLREGGAFTFDDQAHRDYLGLPDGARGRAVALRTGRSPAAGLTLVAFDPAPTEAVAEPTTRPGVCMVAFEVADPAGVDAAWQHLRDLGYEAVSEPMWAEVHEFGRVRGVAVADPDGFLVEFYATEASIPAQASTPAGQEASA